VVDTLELSGLSDAERADLVTHLEQAGVTWEVGPEAEASVDEYGIIDGGLITLVLAGMAIAAVGSWLAGHREHVRIRLIEKTDPDGTVTKEVIYKSGEFHGDSSTARALADVVKSVLPGARGSD